MQLNTNLTKNRVAIVLILSFFVLTVPVFWNLSVMAANGSLAKSQSQGTAKEGSLTSVQQADGQRQEQFAEQKLLKAEKQAAEQKQAELAVDQKFNDLQVKISNFLKQQPGTYGFMLYTQVAAGNRTVEKTIGYNQTESFKMASTYKVPCILYLYEQIAENKIQLGDKLVYDAQFYTTGTGSLQYSKPGGSYTVRELAGLAIRQSDNVALNILIDKLGRDNILKFMQSLGGTAVYEGTPWGTPNDLTIYMKAVENFAKQHPELGNLMLEDLKNTVFNDRIRAGTPQSVVVAHKIGNLPGVLNDVGIVYSAKGPYILALMSKNVPNEQAASYIETQVAKMVYEAIGK